MLYDPKWEQQTKTEPPSLAGLVAWLEQQPKDQSYNCYSITRCVIAQYRFAATGRHDSIALVDIVGGTKAHRDIGCTAPYTFGAALERARAALAFDE